MATSKRLIGIHILHTYVRMSHEIPKCDNRLISQLSKGQEVANQDSYILLYVYITLRKDTQVVDSILMI